MKNMHKLIFSSIGISLLILIPAFASGEVYIPDHEYVGFYDQDGIFTVIGGVKNNEMYPVCLYDISGDSKIGFLAVISGNFILSGNI